MRTIRIFLPALTAAALVLTGDAALAQNFGDVADEVTGQIGQFGNLLGAAATLIGVGLSILGVIKFRAYSANPQDPQNRLTTAIGIVAAGVCLIAVPEFLDVGVTSLFGGTTTTGDFTGANVLGGLGGN